MSPIEHQKPLWDGRNFFILTSIFSLLPYYFLLHKLQSALMTDLKLSIFLFGVSLGMLQMYVYAC